MAETNQAAEGTGKTFRAKHRFAPTSSRKARYAVDLVRGLPVNEALERLQYSPRRSAAMVRKVVQSAVANAGQDAEVDANRLYVSDIRADDGPTHHRGKARSRGQYFAILLRYCHISVEVREEPEGGLPGRRKRIRTAGGSRRRRGAGEGGGSEAGRGEAAREES